MLLYQSIMLVATALVLRCTEKLNLTMFPSRLWPKRDCSPTFRFSFTSCDYSVDQVNGLGVCVRNEPRCKDSCIPHARTWGHACLDCRTFFL